MTDTSTSVVIYDISPVGAIDLKHSLVSDGLVLDVDFNWQYCPVKYSDDWLSNKQERSRATYMFSNCVLASFYRLKWTK